LYINENMNQKGGKEFIQYLQKVEILPFTIAFLLVFVNWSLEAFRWKTILAGIEKISFKTSLKSILSGLPVGFFTPNRIGEIPVRVLFLHHKNRLTAIGLSVIGVFCHTLVVTAGGLISLLYLKTRHNITFIDEKYEFPLYIMLFVLLVAGFWAFFSLPRLFHLFSWLRRYKFWNKLENAYSMISRQNLNKILIITTLRFLVYSSQLLLFYYSFGINCAATTIYGAIFISYLLLTVIPTFFLAEVGIRGAINIFIMRQITDNTMAVICSTFAIWLVNLVLPAILGLYYFYFLRVDSKKQKT
jgi:hypothetical protein